MKITPAHVNFWVKRKAPAFIREALQKKEFAKVNIDSLIPRTKKDLTESRNTTTHNTISLLRGWRNRGENIIDKLEQMAKNGACLDSRKREAICKKWLQRINKEKQLAAMNFEI